MEKKKTFTTRSKEETLRYGERLGENIHRPVTVLMYGDLGAGKTTFTQGLAKGLGITRVITSPTFTIMKMYRSRVPLVHIDAYRLEGVSQDLGFEEYLEEPDGVTVVEWPMFIEEYLPENALEITVTADEEGTRTWSVNAKGEAEEHLLKEWLG